MRKPLMILAILALAFGTASAGIQSPVSATDYTAEKVEYSVSTFAPEKGYDHVGLNKSYDYNREGGEDIGSALVIDALPYSDTGATSDNVDDYDEACPYTGSTSPDVVYSYTPAADEVLNMDLCESNYDTKLYVYDSAMNVVACNDDSCPGYMSELFDVAVTAGETYYIVVDGYGGDSGDYVLNVEAGTPPEPCVIDPPVGDYVDEGEPALVDEYVDAYNGGCNSEPPVWQPLALDAEGSATVYGVAGWYLVGGSGSRDTDWYEVTAMDNEMTLTLTSEYASALYTIIPADCAEVAVDQSLETVPCEAGSLTFTTVPGNTYWIFVAATTYEGPVNEYNYILNVETSHFEPCVLEMPVDPTLEGEPHLGPNYVDVTNGGCNSDPNVLGQLFGDENNEAVLWARSGWYTTDSGDSRDTDWYEVIASGSEISVTAEAEQIFWVVSALPPFDCDALSLGNDVTLEPCVAGSFTFATTPGETYWIIALPTTFTGPVDEFRYILNISGISAAPTCALTGTVTSGGAPLDGASVQGFDASMNMMFDVTTNVIGEYDAGMFNPMDMTVEFSKFGFTPYSASITLVEGANVLDADLVSGEIGSIAGTVTAEGGTALEANMELFTGGELYGSTVCAADGTYMFSDLPFADYTVSASLSGYAGGSAVVSVNGDMIQDFVLGSLEGLILVIDDSPAARMTPAKFDEKGNQIAKGFQSNSRGTTEIVADLTAMGLATVVEDMTSDPATWAGYDLVVVASGDNTSSMGDVAFQGAIAAFASGGGNVLFEGGETGYVFRNDTIMKAALHFDAWNADSSGDVTVADPAHPVMASFAGPMAVIYEGYGDHDALTPSADATAPGSWSENPDKASVICWSIDGDPSTGNTVFFTFDYSSADAAMRPDLLAGAVAWLTAEGTIVPTASVSGTVTLEGETDFSGVLVEFSNGQSMLTAADGMYSFTDLYAGSYSVTVSKDGFGAASADVVLEEDQQLTGVDFMLSPVVEVTECSAPGIDIPDNVPDGIYESLIVDMPAGNVATSIAAYVDITHTWKGDLYVALIAPSGNYVMLHNRSGGSDDNILGWYPDDLLPAEDLDALLGEEVGGEWQLWVSDNAGADTGTLNEWCVRLGYAELSMPTCDLSANVVDQSMGADEVATASVTMANNGEEGSSLDYSVAVSPVGPRGGNNPMAKTARDIPHYVQSNRELFEGFEGAFPPAGWTIEQTHPTNTWFQGDEAIYEGMYNAMVTWIAEDQNEALSFNYTVEDGDALQWWNCASTYWGANATMFVEINGVTVWDYMTNGNEENFVWELYAIPLTDYVGQEITATFRYVGNDGASYYIDNVMMGGAPATVAVTAPNGGEEYYIGDVVTFEYVATEMDNVAISLSRDMGVTWEVIEASTPNMGTYDWTATGPVSSDCMLMVSNVDGTLSDVSDGMFTITIDTSWLTVTPASGSVLAGEEVALEFAFDTAGMADGDYVAYAVIENNSATGTAYVTVNLTVEDGAPSNVTPQVFKLAKNYPNPFNPSTTIKFAVPNAGHVNLSIYDLSGRLVRTLVNENVDASEHTFVWDGRSDNGRTVSSGTYYYRLTADGFTDTQKMMLVK